MINGGPGNRAPSFCEVIMPKVRAIKEVKYASTLRHPGDTFDIANDRDARLLIAVGKVELVPSGPAKKAEKAEHAAKVEATKVEPEAPEEDKPEVRAVEPEAVEAETPEPATSDDQADTPASRRGRYARRDMTSGN